ncbi:phosphodiesterase, MJ0936 family protein [Tritrichomonas foetus]|uniref:Vacuolar protein sorting-associated protein 29 n=1 Tax=Tritrichomonas foetus TaxID=1144522 RepID=A0A1J4K8B7_9EUKA|nr:phosphodiesterase, MJ0936 family protein [Tritrichomonas foetus]|eukprot:OHT07647.1 phosphodiesterase, MJ0936 family protein [Tritrichomonas foetus]
MIILVIGDLNIPQRALKLPEPFAKLLVPGKIHRILCTGNVTSKPELEFLKKICKDVVVVSGDCDDNLPDAKETATVKVGQMNFGIIHGHQILPWGDPERLASYAREMGVDVLISGHTHIPTVNVYEGRLYLNPGSATGCYSSFEPETKPSFMILDTKNDGMTIYHYTLNEGSTVEITQTTYNLR